MILTQHQNGNAQVTIHDNGTRIIDYEEMLQLDYPLNIDIRVSTACSLGYNPKTQKAFCAFCHESARTDGVECDYEVLKEKLTGLPSGTELAIGGNNITPALVNFLLWTHRQGFINNLTVNWMHMRKFSERLKTLLQSGVVRGLGISYRSVKGMAIDNHLMHFPDEFFLRHPNVVLHVIAGIDDVNVINRLPFLKVLVLGYKQFGFGADYFSQDVAVNLQQWVWWVSKLFSGRVVSFDNLAIEQLNIRRFFTPEKWETFYQGEHSMYIDAVAQIYAPSSRSAERVGWNDLSVPEYFKMAENDPR